MRTAPLGAINTKRSLTKTKRKALVMAGHSLGTAFRSGNPEYVRLHVAAKACGCSTSTLRRLCNSGEIECHKTPIGAHRLVSLKACAELFGASVPDEGEATEDQEQEDGTLLSVLYSRVSTSKQKDNGSLDRQAGRLRSHFEANFPGEKCISLSEQGSGINCERKGLLKLFDLALAGKVKRVLIEWQDRLSRGSYVLIAKLLEKCGCEIIITQTGDKECSANTAEEETIHDAMSMIYCMQAKACGRRAQIRRKFVASPETKGRIAGLWASGVSRREIFLTVKKEGHKCMNTGRVFTENGTRSIMAQIKAESKGKVTVMPDCVAKYIAERCHIEKGKRVETSTIWQDFKAFCQQAKINVLHRHKLMGFLNNVKGLAFERMNSGHMTVIWGICLKAA